MKLITLLVGIMIGMSFVTMVLYVAFGQVTVRKLRKNQKTKEALGLEYVSGWDIINVAQAVALPSSWSRKLEESPLSFIYAKSVLVCENTTKFDRILGLFFYWLMVATGFFGILLVILNSLGVLEQ